MPSQIISKDESFLDTMMSPAGRVNIPQMCAAVLDAAVRVFEARSAWLLLHQPERDELVTIAGRGPWGDIYAGAHIERRRGLAGLAFEQKQTVFVPDVRHEHRWFDPERVRRASSQSVVLVPLVVGSEAVGVLGLESGMFTAETPPGPADLERLRSVATMAAVNVQNLRIVAALMGERRQLEARLFRSRHPATDATAGPPQQCELIGESVALHDVMDQIDLVAPADSTVLLIGETGTGKELVAHAIHTRSRRTGRPFVAVNCAALPESLVESELFGYEKGAFTGALTRKPGKFELANHGTLFLDEIGDLPGQAQAKLLRVLQEREVQRVGGTHAEPVNVRLIAATNQDLGSSMRAGRFRSDLFYRLSVFPIRLPPLRERRDDIPSLAEYFVVRFAERLGRPAPRLETDALEQLMKYEWPGNVRELQNVMERAVILARDGVIGTEMVRLFGPVVPGRAALGDRASVRDTAPAPQLGRVIRFSEAERNAIFRAVERAGWRISGRGGAAEILGLKPTTLHAKMRKLGIHRPTATAHDMQAMAPPPVAG